MLSLHLLTIQLFPEYAVIAAIAIAAHWIWLFGFRKNGPQKTVSLKGGYQTGGNSRHSSAGFNTQQVDSIIPKPALSKEILGNTLSNTNIDTTATQLMEEPQTGHSTTGKEANYYLSCELTQRQTEFDLSSALIKLSEGNIPDDELETLHEIATITVAADKQYPQTMEVVQDMLASDPGDYKDLPIIH
jgi:hypothetical protein